MKNFRLFISTTIFFILINSVVFAFGGGGGTSEYLVAFPGAEGFGKDSVGGRGGRVIFVTTTANTGAGSLREACAASGARYVIFRTGGLIELATSCYIDNPYITIAGQTAPGDGICIKTAPIRIRTNDVIMRGLRIRIGDDPSGPPSSNRDGLAFESANNVYDVIIDHCSVSWAIDENFSFWYACHDVTVQWCVSSEALVSAGHPDGDHSMGMIIGDDALRISIHHNLFAHNEDRNPNWKNKTSGVLINNIAYNWQWYGASITGSGGPVFLNTIGNTFVKGLDSGGSSGFAINASVQTSSDMYVEDNLVEGVGQSDAWDIVDGSEADYRSLTKVMPSSAIIIHDRATAKTYVTNNAGAIVPSRDSVDVRIFSSLVAGDGNRIDSPSDVGGWDSYDAGTPTTDADNDGLPDAWEVANSYRIQGGLSSANATDSTQNRLMASYGSPYYAIEVYINELISDRVNLN